MKRLAFLGLFLALVFPCRLAGQNPVMPVYPEEGKHEPDASLVLKEIRTASDRVVVALFNSEIVDLDGVDISDPSQWKLGRKPVKAIHKYVTEADAS